MNIAAHQKKEKAKTAKRKAGEKGKQATEFKEAGCYLSAVVHGKNGEKMICVRVVTGVP